MTAAVEEVSVIEDEETVAVEVEVVEAEDDEEVTSLRRRSGSQSPSLVDL